jgi:acyl-coenzyme A synthetase/AMP-(fatty) acid ligase
LIDAPGGRTVTFAELVQSVRAVAAGFAEGSFGKGEVVARYAPNLLECAVAFHAVATVGGVNATANPLLTEDELAHQLSDCSARLLVTVPERLEAAKVAAKQTREIPTAIVVPSAALTPKEVIR